MSEGPATAEGELARTPLAHLLVYCLDRRLTGALFLTPPETAGGETVVQLDRGVPVKVKPGDGFALLGQMLVAAQAIDNATLEAALATKGLLGDVLLLTDRVERDLLERIAAEQFMRRMVRLFAMPAATTYRYFEAHDALAEYGGDPACVDPLAILWAGIRLHGDVSTQMEATVARLGEGPLRLHPSATASRFALDAEEAPLLEALSAGPVTAAELCARSFPGMARRFLYALAITRQLDTGAGSSPVGAEAAPSSSRRSRPAGDPPSGGSIRVPGAPPVASLGKVALKSTVHRAGAAAPDAPGAGERFPTGQRFPTQGGRRRVNPDGSIDERSSSSVLPPPSSDPNAERAPPDSGVVPVPATPRKPSAPPRVEAQPEAEVEENPLASLSSAELLWLAADYLEQQDVTSAVEACKVGCDIAPEDADLLALHAWARAQVDGADLKAILVELDAVLRAHEGHADARFYRAMVLRRLGDEAASARELRRVTEMAPDHAGARRELATLAAAPVSDTSDLERAVFRRSSEG